jgi:hypothetical protein
MGNFLRLFVGGKCAPTASVSYSCTDSRPRLGIEKWKKSLIVWCVVLRALLQLTAPRTLTLVIAGAAAPKKDHFFTPLVAVVVVPDGASLRDYDRMIVPLLRWATIMK